MTAWQMFWLDERGAVLSTELVLVGTLGVVGATVGLKAVSDSVNGELVDVARAIRSLDQSYAVRGIEGCGASVAGSAFQQEPVDVSLHKLDALIEDVGRSAEADPQAAPPAKPVTEEPRPKQRPAQKQPETPQTKRPDPGSKPADSKPDEPKPAEKTPPKKKGQTQADDEVRL